MNSMTSFFSSPGDDGSSSSSWFFWGAIIIGLAGLLVILFPMMRGFWMRFQMSRQRHRAIRKSRKDIYLRTRLAEVARGGREGEAAEPDVLRRRISELKQNFADGRAALEATGSDAVLRPWFLLLGNEDSGRSSMMAGSDLDLLDAGDSLRGSSANARLRWWFHPSGTILDPAGDVLNPEWGNHGAAEFRQLLRLVKQDRKAPEIGGVVLVIPANKVMGTDDEFGQEVSRLRSMMLDIGRTLGLNLPVYLVVSKCDQIPGMSPIMDGLAEGRQFRQMVGWSAGKSSLDHFDEQSMRAGMEELVNRIKYVSDSLVARRDLVIDSTIRDRFMRSADLFELPQRIEEFTGRMVSLASAIFGEAAALHDGRLRGVYLTAVGENAGSGVKRTSGRFIRDLFAEKIFREKTLAGVSRARFRRIYSTMVAAAFAIFLVLALFLAGTIRGRELLEIRAANLGLAWSQVEPRILQGDVLRSPMIEQNAQGDFEVVGDKPLHGGGPRRQLFLDSVAADSFEPIPVPAAYRLTAPSQGTWADNLLWRQRQLAYRAAFNPMVLGPIVDATILKLGDPSLVWTAPSTTAWAGILQIEQAGANLSQDWTYSSEIGDLNTAKLLAFVLDYDSVASIESAEDGFTAAVGSNELLSSVSIQAMADSLTAASVGSAGLSRAVVDGFSGYRKAWGELDYRATLPLGKAEVAVQAVLDFNAAVVSLEELGKSVEIYTRITPSEMQVAATVADWNRANRKAELAIKAWKTSTSALDMKPNETLAELVARATVSGTAAVSAQFDMLKARTVVLGESSILRSGQLLNSIQEELGFLRNKVVKDQVAIAKRLAKDAKTLDLSVWIKPTESRSVGSAQTSAKEPMAFLPEKMMAVMLEINDRMASRPSGSVANFNVTVSTQAMQSRRLYGDVTDSMKELGASDSIKRFKSSMSMLTLVANWNAMFWAIANTIDSLPRSTTEIAAQVESRVDASVAWFRPGIPLGPNPDSGVFAGEYNPKVAEEVVAPWRLVRSQIDSVVSPSEVNQATGTSDAHSTEGGKAIPSIPMKGQPQLNARYRGRVTALEGYANRYLDYWVTEMRQAGQIELKPDWDSYRAGIASIQPFQVNSALLSYLQQVELALEVSFLTNSQNAADTVGKALASVKTQVSQLTPMTTASAKAAIGRWEGLSENPARARVELLNLTVGQFTGNYFYMYAPGRPETVAYWDSLTKAGLDSLSTAVSQGAKSSMAAIIPTANRWPVLDDQSRSPALTQAQIDSMASTIGRFMVGPRAQVDGSTTSPGKTGANVPDSQSTTLLAGGKTSDPGVNYELDRLRDGLLPSQGLPRSNVSPAATEYTASQRVGNVIMALSGTPSPMTGTLVQPPIERLLMVPSMPTAQRDPVSAAMQFRYVEIWVDGKQVGPRIETMRGDGGQMVQKSIRILAAASELTFKFFRSIDATTEGAEATWKTAWALIDAYLDPRTVSDAKTGISWIAVTFNNQVELECYWWLGLRFDRPLPAVNQWPTLSDWPYDPIGPASE